MYTTPEELFGPEHPRSRFCVSLLSIIELIQPWNFSPRPGIALDWSKHRDLVRNYHTMLVHMLTVNGHQYEQPCPLSCINKIQPCNSTPKSGPGMTVKKQQHWLQLGHTNGRPARNLIWAWNPARKSPSILGL